MKQSSNIYDVLIVGSGPSGVQAALQALHAGVKVGLVDVGYTDTSAPIPERSWSNLQKLPKDEWSKIFKGENEAQSARAGVHLTPSRLHMIKHMEELFPLRGRDFFALQATARGGLGASWGANAFVFDDEELNKVGLTAEEMRPYYKAVSENVGISGGGEDIAHIAKGLAVQPPLPIDTNAASLLSAYERSKQWFASKGFVMGQSLLAVLSKPISGRGANPLFDMDFWSDAKKSVYRPNYTLEEIDSNPAFKKQFTYLTGRQALSFVETDGQVALEVKTVETEEKEIIYAKKLLLAAGAIGSARIVLQSRKEYTSRLPLLCNRNVWMAAINVRMLGRRSADARHSLAQLTALWGDTIAQFYSYRSLLPDRLNKDIPLPGFIFRPLLRLVQSALTMINVHYSDAPSDRRYMKLGSDGVVEVVASFSDEEEAAYRLQERGLVKIMRRLGLIVLRIARPMHGASIHYAGTLPDCDAGGKLNGCAHVFVADGSSWKFLPAKGLTLTLMANARRVAQNAVNELHA